MTIENSDFFDKFYYQLETAGRKIENLAGARILDTEKLKAALLEYQQIIPDAICELVRIEGGQQKKMTLTQKIRKYSRERDAAINMGFEAFCKFIETNEYQAEIREDFRSAPLEVRYCTYCKTAIHGKNVFPKIKQEAKKWLKANNFSEDLQ